MDRALPGWAVDLIHDGVDRRDLRERGDRAVWSALVRTAASAHQRGWDQMEWEHLLHDPRSRLGALVRVKGGKPQSPLQVVKTLAAVWDTAVVWTSEQTRPLLTRADAEAEARGLAAEVRDWCADPDAPLTDTERAILHHAADVADRHGSLTPTLPRRPLSAATGLGNRAVRTGLTRLVESGLLEVVDAGRSSTDPSRRRAARYRLPDREARAAHSLYRETRSVGPPRQVCGTPGLAAAGTPAPSVGPPSPSVVTVTVSADDPAVLTETLRALLGNPGVDVVEHHDQGREQPRRLRLA